MKIKTQVEDLGDVVINRRKGAKNIRLRVDGTGIVYLTLPWWAPKTAGLAFLHRHLAWLKEQQQDLNFYAKDGQNIGHAFELKIIITEKTRTTFSLEEDILAVYLPKNSKISNSQEILKKQITKALKLKVLNDLIPRLNELAGQHSLKYKEANVKTLKSRWGSCSNSKKITLNTYLAQLPNHLIDYVLLHELMHTKHLHHGKDFWNDLTKVLPNTKELKVELKKYRPHLF